MNLRERHRRLHELFLGARGLSADTRTAYLDRSCGGDAELRREVELLLAHDERPNPQVEAAFREKERDDVRERLAEVLASEAGRTEDDLPKRIGPFRILHRLGEGGMGVVYEAEQEHPRRTVALKVLHPAFLSPAIVRRFEHESELLGRLSHPGIAQVYSSGRGDTEHGPQPWFAMELVRGAALTDFARERRLDLRERLELIAQVADAVQHAHQHGVIHRDLKPANILVEDSGRARVLDFGVARALDSDVQLTTVHTDVGQILGTLAYMSPEQAAGDSRAIDTRSDVYSLGVLLYELLAGRLPYEVSGKLLPEAVRVIREVEPRRLSGIETRLRGDIETIVGAALEKDKERRYASAAALAADIRRFLDHEPISARPASRLYTLRKFVRRNRTVVGATLAVLVALALGLVASLRFGLREAAQRRLADARTREARGELYRSSLLSALQALDSGHSAVAEEQLESAPPELRNWEWRHLHRRLDPLLTEGRIPNIREAAYLDEERILTVDGAGVVRIWDTRTDDWSDVASTGRKPLALSPDGRWWLSYADGSVILGDPLAGAEAGVVFPFPGGEPKAYDGSSAVARDGSRAVVTSAENELFLLERDAESIVSLSRGIDVYGTVLSADGRLLGLGLLFGYELWDVERRERCWGFEGDEWIYAVDFDPTGSTLAVGTKNRIKIHDAASGQELHSWSVPKLPLFDHSCRILYAPDGQRLLVTLPPGHMGVLDADGGSLLLSMKQPRGAWVATGSAFSPSGATLLSISGPEDTVRVWNADLARWDVLHGQTSYVYGVAVSPDGELVASGSWDGTVRLWDLASREEIVALSAPSIVRSLAISSDGLRVACGHDTGVRIWETRSGRVVAALDLGPTWSLALSSDGAFLAAGGARTHPGLRVFDARNWQELEGTSITSNVSALAYSPDGRLLAVGLGEARLLLLEHSSGATLGEFSGTPDGKPEFKGVLSLAFSPAGDRLLAGWGNSNLTLHAVPSLEELAVLRGHDGEVFAARFSPDGNRIASGGRDGLLRLWDATGHILLTLAGHEDYIYALAFDPSGRRIVTGSGDTTVRVWDSEPAIVGWKERAVTQHLRPAAERLVEGLFEELGDASAVVARLEKDRELSPDLLRMARQEVLRGARSYGPWPR